jgi:hypothetical protein
VVPTAQKLQVGEVVIITALDVVDVGAFICTPFAVFHSCFTLSAGTGDDHLPEGGPVGG